AAALASLVLDGDRVGARGRGDGAVEVAAHQAAVDEGGASEALAVRRPRHRAGEVRPEEREEEAAGARVAGRARGGERAQGRGRAGTAAARRAASATGRRPAAARRAAAATGRTSAAAGR